MLQLNTNTIETGVEKTLQLKVGAQVMCLKNLDVPSGLVCYIHTQTHARTRARARTHTHTHTHTQVNGARGVVVGLAANSTSIASNALDGISVFLMCFKLYVNSV